MEVLVRSYRTRRPNGAELLVDEYWDFVDTSPRFTGTSYAPGMKRLALRSGGRSASSTKRLSSWFRPANS